MRIVSSSASDETYIPYIQDTCTSPLPTQWPATSTVPCRQEIIIEVREIEYLKKLILDWLPFSDGGSTWSEKQRRGDVPCLHIDRVERPEGTWCDRPAAPDRGFSGVLGFCATLLSASDPSGTWAALDPFRGKQSIPLQSPSQCCYHYSDRLRLSWCYWNARGETSCFTYTWKINLENGGKVVI